MLYIHLIRFCRWLLLQVKRNSINPDLLGVCGHAMIFAQKDNCCHLVGSVSFESNGSTRCWVLEEVGAILKVYLRFEPAINKLLLPVTRQRNRFCRDFREVLGRAQGLGECASDEQLFSVIDSAVAAIKGMSPEIRAACINGCRITTTKEALMLALLGEAGLWRLKRPILTSDANGQQLLLPAGMALKELFSTDGRRLWRPPTSQELQALWGKDGEGGPKAGSSAEESLADPPTPWTALEETWRVKGRDIIC